jgi:hypothetical protein
VLLTAELKTTLLDRGIPGFSQTHLLFVFGMSFAIAMIPYFFLFLSLLPKRANRKAIGWLHPHRHPELLHH